MGTSEADLRTGQFVCSDQLLYVLDTGEGQKAGGERLVVEGYSEVLRKRERRKSFIGFRNS